MMLAVLLAVAQAAQAPVLVDMHNLATHEHRVSAFVLSAPQTLHVTAIGAEPWPDQFRKRDDTDWQNDEQTTWPAAAWILDARTREVVWDLRAVETTREANGLRHFDGSLRLPAGTYEVHYASFPSTFDGFSLVEPQAQLTLRDLVRLGRRVRFGGPYVENGLYTEFGITIEGAGHVASGDELRRALDASAAAAVVRVTPEPEAGARSGFVVARPTTLEVYAVGELTASQARDSSWIVNLATRQRVWTMTYAGTEPAGGSARNRMAREALRLAPGRYVAYYARRESHGPEDWNRMPPADPDYWGVAVRATDPAARAAVRPFDYQPVPEGQTIVSLIGVGDDALKSQGFTLRRPLDVHVYALGEQTGPQLVDYAWIIDAERHAPVWTMRADGTQPAGGAEKNRLADTTIHLDSGSYIVYYRSDGSHSAAGWNGAPPIEGRYWGVSVYPASGHLNRADVTAFEPAGHSGAALASLVPMGDNEDARAPFRLSSPARVRIYALGEGQDGEMNDYGWIEDSLGTRVWEMHYAQTDNAGGDEKNRVFSGVVTLPAGSYVLRYRSDDSHSHDGWNAAPPADPDNWGIAVLVFGPHENRRVRQARPRLGNARQDRR